MPISLLGVYYCFNMVIIMMSIILSTFVVNVGRGGDDKRRVPELVQYVSRTYNTQLIFPYPHKLLVRNEI